MFGGQENWKKFLCTSIHIDGSVSVKLPRYFILLKIWDPSCLEASRRKTPVSYTQRANYLRNICLKNFFRKWGISTVFFFRVSIKRRFPGQFYIQKIVWRPSNDERKSQVLLCIESHLSVKKLLMALSYRRSEEFFWTQTFFGFQ